MTTSMLFPAPRPGEATTGVELAMGSEGLPVLLWAGVIDGHDVSGTAPRIPRGPGMPLLGEQSHGLLTRPLLRGYRERQGVTGAAWSPCFRLDTHEVSERRLRLRGSDTTAELSVDLELESLVGGAFRTRCTVVNTGPDRYVVDGLELALPVPDQHVEILDFTGRHERERAPQRHQVTDGLWVRESRGGRPGLGSATQLIIGTPGFSFTHGELMAVHVAWSGNSVLRLERSPATGTTIGGGELLMPGEVSLEQGDSYTSPWVMFAAVDDGLDALASVWHTWARSLPAHPRVQPVVLNVWEAVYFDHDLDRLTRLADLAARVGVERFVLDDGWFRHRRDDGAGLGDWYVDESMWPDGLGPLADRVLSLGMEFGLWFEPEMVNPDSDLYRAHPEWILAPEGRVPLPERNQQVLDLSRREVFDYLFERVSSLLTAYPISFVKWDHNRDLLEPGSLHRHGAPAARAQTLAFYRLLDALRAAHPGVAWESCASGGGRVDLGVLERVERVWTSDMTDALARQQIQRWTQQLVPPEYLGAHVSAPVAHSTWRSLYLDFRAATAMFGAFGIEWDLGQATEEDLDRLASWIQRFRRFRPLLHGGRTVRPESSDPAVLLHGVLALDRSEALLAHVQLDESHHNRGVWVRLPGLDADAVYHLAWEGPVIPWGASHAAALPPQGPTEGRAVTGAALARRGFWMPRCRPEQVTLVHVTRGD